MRSLARSELELAQERFVVVGVGRVHVDQFVLHSATAGGCVGVQRLEIGRPADLAELCLEKLGGENLHSAR